MLENFTSFKVLWVLLVFISLFKVISNLNMLSEITENSARFIMNSIVRTLMTLWYHTHLRISIKSFYIKGGIRTNHVFPNSKLELILSKLRCTHLTEFGVKLWTMWFCFCRLTASPKTGIMNYLHHHVNQDLHSRNGSSQNQVARQTANRLKPNLINHWVRIQLLCGKELWPQSLGTCKNLVKGGDKYI